MIDFLFFCFSYVRGVPFLNNSFIHIPGVGDNKIKDICFLPDPCPLPEHLKKRSLDERERLLYAPFSGVGGIIYDKDATYIELGGSHHYHKKDEAGIKWLQNQEILDQELVKAEFQLFKQSAPVTSQDVKQIFKQSDSSEDTSKEKKEFDDNSNTNTNTNNDEAESSDSDDESIMNESDDEENNDKDFEIDEDDETDDDDESDDDDNETSQSKKRKSTQKSLGEKKIKLDQSVTQKIEENELLQRNLNVVNSHDDVKDKVTGILNTLLCSKSKENEESANDSDNESFDELSENESLNFDSNLEKDIDFENEENSDVDNESGNSEEEEEEENSEKEEEEEEPTQLDGLNKKSIIERAREDFMNRQKLNVNLQRLVYGCFDDKILKQEENKKQEEEENDEENDEDDNFGGIFRVVQEKQKRKIEERELQNQDEYVFYSKEPLLNWIEESNKDLLVNRFVTGKWKDSEDAETLLKLGKYTINKKYYLRHSNLHIYIFFFI